MGWEGRAVARVAKAKIDVEVFMSRICDEAFGALGERRCGLGCQTIVGSVVLYTQIETVLPNPFFPIR